MIKDFFNKILQVVKSNLSFTITVLVIIAAIVAMLIYSSYGGNIFGNSSEAIAKKAVGYINENFLKTSGTAEFTSVSDFSTMYKVNFKITYISGGEAQDAEAFLTKDGRYLFPSMQGIPIDLQAEVESSDNSASTSEITACEDVKKSDKPVLEAYVVSQCPYGLQMQRVFEEAIRGMGTINNLKIRYIGSVSDGKITSMHGDAEAQENLRQICIREEQPAKYWNYVPCYIKEGKTDACLTSSGVDKTNLNACVADANRGLKYAQEDFTLADQYGVSGSPTLILEGDKISESGFGGRTADAVKSIVCCASNVKPAFCSTDLSKETAAAGFSKTYKSSSDSNSSNNANCGQ